MMMLQNNDFIIGVLLIVFMLWFEYLVKVRNFSRAFMNKPLIVRYSAYLTMLFFLLIFGIFSQQEFFYFQF